MRFFKLALGATTVIGNLVDNCIANNGHGSDRIYSHVAVFSIDGLHSSDVEKYIALKRDSTIAKLLQTGYECTDALTSAPSDSFPGTLNQFTGASPRTTGVWYDDTYDRTFFDSGSDCSEKPGAEGMRSYSVHSSSLINSRSGL